MGRHDRCCGNHAVSLWIDWGHGDVVAIQDLRFVSRILKLECES